MAATDITTERPPLTDVERAAIRARLAAATEGPWEVDDRTSALPRVYSTDPDVDTPPMIAEVHNVHDAVLIAHAPTDLAALLAERDDLASENQRLRDTIQAVEVLRDRYRSVMPYVANRIDQALAGRDPIDVLRDRLSGVSGE